MKTLQEFMSEDKITNRWVILFSALVGGFAGAILMFMMVLLGLVA